MSVIHYSSYILKLNAILCVFCHPSQGAKAKAEEKDPKKLKKQEKEEKDFRKKFKVRLHLNVIQSSKC